MKFIKWFIGLFTSCLIICVFIFVAIPICIAFTIVYTTYCMFEYETINISKIGQKLKEKEAMKDQQ